MNRWEPHKKHDENMSRKVVFITDSLISEANDVPNEKLEQEILVKTWEAETTPRASNIEKVSILEE